ncbi:ribonuclease P protein component [Dysgonomonas sp. Marseille-P4677]|uniref:ribonuclease P protein component n=1 Tax=Dysgonomonas sp. Marseille-P4677 TaxID=2364790 RepID=UPI001912468D|nr:ribonuclease P protein component [Dysgonomonas sp. Marseille-P4677]MBK5722721.1 ribonuclease P protein component [Dysgonomonas sp. Marseille-P4677]
MNTDSIQKNTFSKEEKLCSTKSIDTLFSQGESFIAYPLRVVYRIEAEPDECKQFASLLISVSKKKFKRAVKRNRVKRLVREAYRLNKLPIKELLSEKNIRMDIAFLYLKDELPTYADIEKSILKTISILSDRLKKEG